MVFDNIAGLAGNYHMPGVQLDGNDIKAVHSSVSLAAARARCGEGPTLIELKTQRFNGHSSGDPQVYRTKTTVEELRRSRDPISRLETELVSAGLLANRDALMAEIEAEVAQAVLFAESSPYPADDELSRDVYAESR
jgi:pyruvate dehydrogenase E1 component alpha subunit